MALPKLSTPTYELEIPSTKKKIKYRPFHGYTGERQRHSKHANTLYTKSS